MSRANDNEAAVTWGSFFDDECQEELDGCDADFVVRGGIEQQLLVAGADGDASQWLVDPSAAEASRDIGSWNGFDNFFSEEIDEEAADVFPGGAGELPEEDVADFEVLNLKDDAMFANLEASGSCAMELHDDPGAEAGRESRNGPRVFVDPSCICSDAKLPDGVAKCENVLNNLKDDAKFSQQESSDPKNQGSSRSKTSILSLRQWIKCTTDKPKYINTDIWSPAYITSAIKIAIELVTQIIDAEDLHERDVHDKLDPLPLSAAHDWAEHVVLHLNDTQSLGNNRDDLRAHVEEILHLQRTTHHVHSENTRAPDVENTGQNDLKDPSIPQSDSNPHSDSCDKDFDCFNVKSAQIQCPESDSPSNTENAHMQRIFYLGLVFYELFSGGQRPPSKLCALASAEGAFESLTAMTVAPNSNDEDHQLIGSNKRLQSVNQDGGPCRVYCEYLKLSNVSNSLCYLILNMLDCVCGVFAGKDSYSQLREVQFDLQLMLDKPKFLRGLNMDALSSQPGRSLLDEICISREQEVRTILSCYRRCMSGSFEISIVKGSSGTGKSFLTQLVKDSIVSQGGIFLVGKFDQMQQSKPFSGLAAALDQYCALLIDQLGSDWANAAVDKLRAALGIDASYLIKIVPKLRLILDHDVTNSPPDDLNDLGIAFRIQHLLCLFVETISSSSMVAVTLCLDDVQWMDAASISVMRRVLVQTYNKLFFLACCRHDEMSNTHPFWVMIESVCSSGTLSTSVELKNVNANVLENVISDLLCLPPRLVKPLAGIVHSKTKGLPLFVSEMLRALNRDRLLRVDLDSQRWVWDQDKIRAAKLPDNVALCFTNGIIKLPAEVQVALHTLSMFGSSVKSEYIKALEKQLNINLTEPLKIAMKEGLVNKLSGSYHFSHDWIQETCYGMIQEQDRILNHLTYGRCLSKLALETNNDEMMFTSANQINLGGPEAINAANEYMTMASYNLMVGKKAIEIGDFPLAYNLFCHGIKFLPQQHWEHYYAVSLDLHECAARAALATGNIDDIRPHSEIILKHARCFDDQLHIHRIVMLSLMHTSKFNEALELGMGILTQLDEGITRNPTEDDFIQEVKRTQAMIAGISEDFIMGHRLMADKRKRSAMKFLGSLHTCSLYFTEPSLHGLVVLKMVQLTITYGLSNLSPIGLALFGALLSNMGNIPVGHRFSQLSMTLLGKLESKDYAGETLCLVTRVKCLVEPLQALGELQLQAESASVLAGDVQYARLNRFFHCSNKFWAGENLADVHEEISRAVLFFKEHDHETVLNGLLIIQWVCSTLMGNKSEEFDPQNDKAVRTALNFSFYKLFLSFLFGRDDTLECGKVYYELNERLRSSKQSVVGEFVIRALPPGLAAFRLYRETKDPMWLKRGQKCKDNMQVWSERGCKWNFEQKLLLLRAEESYCLGDCAAAKECYKNAISAAKSHKFLNDEAFALELAASFYSETGDLPTSLEHFRLAHERYSEWGAYAKANQVLQQIKEKEIAPNKSAPAKMCYVRL